MSPTPSRDDETTMRIMGWARGRRGDDNEEEPEERRRVEIGALVFGSILAGVLLTALWGWLRDENVPHEQTMQFVFMTLTSGAVVGLFVSIVAAVARQVKSDVRRTLQKEHAALREIAEQNVQSAMGMLRSVAFSINDARRDADQQAMRIYTLVADALERGGFASTAEIGELRAEVDALRARTEEAVTGYAAGFVDGLIAQEEQESGHPHLRVIKQNPVTRDDGPWTSGGGKR